jgi:hypothetical protein
LKKFKHRPTPNADVPIDKPHQNIFALEYQLAYNTCMISRILGIFLIFIFSTAISGKANYREIHYSRSGNFKALMNKPKDNRKRPVIIYVYDEYFDWIGIPAISKRGYDLRNFLDLFEEWGFIGIIPLERYRRVNAVKGAIAYARSLPNVKKNEIHVVGVSEGGFIALLAVDDQSKARSLTLVLPRPVHYSGHYSFPGLVRKMDEINTRLLFIFGEEDKKWRVRLQKNLYEVLVRSRKKVSIRSYPRDRKAFWNPHSFYMDDIHKFMTGRPAPLPIPEQLEKEMGYGTD